jgi:hypothetical protein
MLWQVYTWHTSHPCSVNKHDPQTLETHSSKHIDLRQSRWCITAHGRSFYQIWTACPLCHFRGMWLREESFHLTSVNVPFQRRISVFFLCHHIRGLAITVSVRIKLQLFPYRLLNSTSSYSSLTFLYAWKHTNFNHVSRRRQSTLASIPMRKTLQPGKLRMPCDNCRCDIRRVYKLRKQRCPTVAYRQSTTHIQFR